MYRALKQGVCLRNLIVAVVAVLFFVAAQAQSSKNGDGGPALAATINGPSGIAVDDDGSIFVLENKGRRIRRIDSKAGVITTIAGNGKRCCFDENLPAIEFALHYPIAISVDHEHNLYISDRLATIRRVDAKTGRMSTVVREASDRVEAPSFDDGETVEGLAVNPKDSTRTIYAVGRLGHIYKIREGSVAVLPVFDRSVSTTNPQSGPLMDPLGVAVDATENLFIADYENCRIMRVESGTGNLSVVAGTGECKPSEDGRPARLTSIEHPTAIAINPHGDIYFATPDTQSCVRRIDYKTGLIKSIRGTCETKSGTPGPPCDTCGSKPEMLGPPVGLAADSRGNIYFTLWSSNLVRKIDSETGQIATVAGNGLPHRHNPIL